MILSMSYLYQLSMHTRVGEYIPDVNFDNVIRKPITREVFLNKVKAAIAQGQMCESNL